MELPILGMFTGIIQALAFWGFIAAIIIVPQYFKHRDRNRMYDTMKAAIDKGQPVPPEFLVAMQSNTSGPEPIVPTAERDLRRAIVLIAVGLGLAGLGYGLWFGLMAASDTAAYIVGGVVAGCGAIPGLIGVAYLILWAVKRGDRRV